MSNLNDKQKLALRCAYADLLGVIQRGQNGVPDKHDIEAVKETMDELEAAFPKVKLK